MYRNYKLKLIPKIQWLKGGNRVKKINPWENGLRDDVLPTGLQEYEIQPGDTLSKIAKRFGTTVDDLQELNGIFDTNKIYAGDTIYVPWESGAPVKQVMENIYYTPDINTSRKAKAKKKELPIIMKGSDNRYYKITPVDRPNLDDADLDDIDADLDDIDDKTSQPYININIAPRAGTDEYKKYMSESIE